jgi:hypothetical protein
MTETESRQKHLIAFFRQFVETAGGGIFTTKTRKRLLGMSGLSGRDRTKNDFWNDVRKRVRNAQKDLQLFVMTSDRDQVNQVITAETLVPAIRALLDSRMSDLNRAEIARLFITEGFSYLQGTSVLNITLAHDRTITEAIDLANYLVTHYTEK